MKLSLVLLGLGLLELVSAATVRRPTAARGQCKASLTRLDDNQKFDSAVIEIFSMTTWAKTLSAAVRRGGQEGLSPKIPIPQIFVPTVIKIFREHRHTIEHNTKDLENHEKFDENMEQEVAESYYYYHVSLKESLYRLLNDRYVARRGFQLMEKDEELLSEAKKYTETVSEYLDKLIELGSNDENKGSLTKEDKEYYMKQINDWMKDWQDSSSRNFHKKASRHGSSSIYRDDNDDDNYETPMAAVQVAAMDTWADRAMEVKFGYYPDEAVPELVVEMMNENTRIMKEDLEEIKKEKFDKEDAPIIALVLAYMDADMEVVYRGLSEKSVIELFRKQDQTECLMKAVKKRTDVLDEYLEEMLRLTTRDKDEGFRPETKKRMLENLRKFAKKFQGSDNERRRKFGKHTSKIEITVQELLRKKH